MDSSQWSYYSVFFLNMSSFGTYVLHKCELAIHNVYVQGKFPSLLVDSFELDPKFPFIKVQINKDCN